MAGPGPTTLSCPVLCCTAEMLWPRALNGAHQLSLGGVGRVKGEGVSGRIRGFAVGVRGKVGGGGGGG